MKQQRYSFQKLFPGHYRPSTEEFQRLWNNATFSFDANLLLNVYRYSHKTRHALFDVISKISKRIVITHQAAVEFHKNRLSTIAEQADLYGEVSSSLSTVMQSLEADRKHPFISARLLVRSKEVFGQLAAELKDNGDKIEQLLVDDRHLATITKLLGASILPRPSEADFNSFETQARERGSKKIPPGYCDYSKSADNAPGDAIIWLELLKWAKEEPSDIIFVTDDTKEDWWTRVGGKTIYARPELVSEFESVTGKKIYIYQPGQFIEFASSHFGLGVHGEVVDEIREVTRSRRRSVRPRLSATPQYERLTTTQRSIADAAEHASMHSSEVLLYIDCINSIPPSTWKGPINLLQLDPRSLEAVSAIRARCPCVRRIVSEIHAISEDEWSNNLPGLTEVLDTETLRMAYSIRKLPKESTELLHVLRPNLQKSMERRDGQTEDGHPELMA